MKPKLTTQDIEAAFPWMAEVRPVTGKIVETLYEKEADYRGSWQKRGGIGAFMMLARKWDRLENICGDPNMKPQYDILEAMTANVADICDDVDDLIAYLILCKAEAIRRSKIVKKAGKLYDERDFDDTDELDTE